MEFDLALRVTEILLGWALFQQSLEHLSLPSDRGLYGLRAALAAFLTTGLWSGPILLALSLIAVIHLSRWQGPYNGGADRMGTLILFCLTGAVVLPNPAWRELSFAYLGGQLVLSYVISGWVKVVNPEWRQGRALCDVFRFSAYPVSEGLRAMADRPRLLFIGGWSVILFELAFPLALWRPETLWLALAIAAAFHFSNACFFGLNRFFWTWIAAYPALLWLQERLMG